jgi:septal ring factor EnvC (AmiA/AmiB activator)
VRLPFSGNFPITQVFGVNPADYAQFGMKGHNGIDYGLPTGTPVVAATAGTAYVLSDPPGFGNYLQVVGKDYKTIYAHLKSATVSNGQQVSEGQQIGVSDNTGNSSGPHLHFGVKPIVGLNNNNGFFGAIDPQPLLNQGTTDMLNNPDDVKDLYLTLLGRAATDAEAVSWTGKSWHDVYYSIKDSPEAQAHHAAEAAKLSDLTEQAQKQQGTIDSLNKQVSSVTAERDSAREDVQALQAKLDAQPPNDTNPPSTTPDTEPTQPTPAPTWFAGFVEWLKSLIKQSK